MKFNPANENGKGMSASRLKYKGQLQIFVVAVCLVAVFVIVHTIRKLFSEDALLKAGQLKYHGSNIIPDIMTGPVNKLISDDEDEGRYMGSLRMKKKDLDDAQHLNTLLGEKLVHLDLKGAPPRITYYEELFPFLKKLGATGLLLEYEDMFPYHDDIEDITCYNSYSKVDINEIVRLAEVNNLIIVPLVQTFGHLEFVLKAKKYSELREVETYPQVICPTNNKTNPLLFEMIDQIVSYHPGIKYLHIGSDEVYHLGQCSRCISTLTQNNWTKRQLFLNHTYTIAKYVKDTHNIIPIIWDDELRTATIDEIKDSRITDLIEIMIWKYVPDVKSYITDDILEKYSMLFNNIWIASAFKGATGPDKYITDISHHYLNHKSWLEIVTSWSSRVKFRGIAITGWQRYDHFAILCELLPVGLPSLAVSLLYLQSGAKDISAMSDKLQQVMNCDIQYAMTPSDLIYLQSTSTSRCQFPGSSVYHMAVKLYTIQQEIDKCFQHTSLAGWMSYYHIKYQFSNPFIIEYATADFDRLRTELKYLEAEVKTAMDEIYDKYTISEWIESFVKPLQNKITQIIRERNHLLNVKEWPRRPLGINTESN